MRMNTTSGPGAVAVIGAGIVGLSVATQLQREGLRVTVLDRDDPMQACSAGNAGYLSDANIFPPASRDMLAQLPRLMLSREGPLVIRPAYAHRMLPWTRHALKVLQPQALRVVTETLASMTRIGYAAIHDLAALTGASSLLSRDGGLVVFKSATGLEKKCRALETWNNHGLPVRRVSAAEALALEPALADDIVGGLYFMNSGRCANPQRLGQLYAAHFLRNGGRILREEVRSVEPQPDGGVDLHTSSGRTRFERVVVCAGYWGGALMKPFFRSMPIVSERGYHLMLPNPSVVLSRPVVFGEPHFAATPMEGGLRLAGTAEFSAPDAEPNMHRATMLLQLADRYLKGVRGEGARPWMGIRPSFPDGLPAIGRLTDHPALLYAFGHAHNGLTLSGVTSLCIAALIQGKRPPIDLAPLDLARFSTSPPAPHARRLPQDDLRKIEHD
jgi:glycine/D-amino acid oxidase-like deaminating enzyme